MLLAAVMFEFLQELAVFAATGTLAFSVASVAAGRTLAPVRGVPQLVRSGWGMALLMGVPATIVVALALTMRIFHVAIDVVQGYPCTALASYGFDGRALIVVPLLLLSCAAAAWRTRDGRLLTCAFWLAAMFIAWSVLLASPTRATRAGGFERTGVVLLLLSSLSLLLGATVLWACWWVRRRAGRETTAGPLPPGFAVSALVTAAVIGLLGWFQLLVYPGSAPSGGHFAAFVVSASTALAALACFRLFETAPARSSLAEAAIALGSLTVVSAAVLALPPTPRLLSERFPMIFNAMMIGLVLSAASCTWMAVAGRRAEHDSAGVASPWDRLRGCAARFVFLNAVIAFVVGVMMTTWPRVPGIAATDDSYGRVLSGLAGHLGLLLVASWSARHLQRVTLHLLTFLAVLSTLGFLIARMLPFTSSIH